MALWLLLKPWVTGRFYLHEVDTRENRTIYFGSLKDSPWEGGLDPKKLKEADFTFTWGRKPWEEGLSQQISWSQPQLFSLLPSKMEGFLPCLLVIHCYCWKRLRGTEPQVFWSFYWYVLLYTHAEIVAFPFFSYEETSRMVIGLSYLKPASQGRRVPTHPADQREKGCVQPSPESDLWKAGDAGSWGFLSASVNRAPTHRSRHIQLGHSLVFIMGSDFI